MTIQQRPPKPSKADEKRAYTLCTERDMGRCVRCGSSQGVQRDHRRNRSQGGETVVWQLQLLCAICHLWKGANPVQAVLDGFAVPLSKHSPRSYPARRLVFGELRWCVYGDSTTYAVISEREAEVRRENLGVI